MKRAIVICCLFCLSLIDAASAGEVFHVTTNGLATASGASWADATTLSNAVAKATTEGSVVFVSNGTYQLDAQLLIDRPCIVRGLTNNWDDVIFQGPPRHHGRRGVECNCRAGIRDGQGRHALHLAV